MTENISFLPVYDFSTQINAELLRKVLPLLMQHKVPANPINYAIWYEYAADTNSHLNNAIDELVNNKTPITQDVSFNLYKKYVCNASLELYEKIRDKLHSVVSETKDSIQTTHHKTIEASQRFQESTTLLENFSEKPELQIILHEIIHETKSLSRTSLTLQSKLDKANQEIEQLRTELNQVRTLALTDGLTGLLNRRAFNQTLDSLIQQDELNNIFLAILDIDHFKRVNDTHGHIVGDHIIKYVATLMRKHTEADHYIARYGGEEMAVIMANITKEKAFAIAENIRSALEKSLLKRKDNGGPLGRITISIGITAYRPDDDAESFIKRADMALYTAKETGRNKIVFATS